MQIPLGILNTFLRYVEKPYLHRQRTPEKIRQRFRRQARVLFPSPPFSTYLPICLGQNRDSPGVPATWVSAGSGPHSGLILYFHGGSYVFGAPSTHRAMLARLSEMTGLYAVLPAYRVAPEHPFPAAADDALTCYQAILAKGYRPERIILGGDSSGGGLMLALLQDICTQNLPRPGGAFAFSPWTDLTLGSESLGRNASSDPLLPASRTVEMRDMYLAGADSSGPRASPLFGIFDGAPPVMIQVSDSEILLDDSRRMAEALRAQGRQVRLDIWKNTPHVWQIFQGHLAEADQALADVAGFIRARRAASNGAWGSSEFPTG